jgi:hypothetical protein
MWSKTVFRSIDQPTPVTTPNFQIAQCAHCSELTLWIGEKMVFPIGDFSGIAEPNPDLNQDIQEDYSEAKAIFDKSSRGSAALLRLALQKLCVQLGEKGKNINDDIASLVQKGLPVKIQQALDIVRVIGNNAVHPGQIDLKDDPDSARQLFALTNLIADVMVSQPKHVEAIYQYLPQTARDAIQKRDGTP